MLVNLCQNLFNIYTECQLLNVILSIVAPDSCSASLTYAMLYISALYTAA
jgi:hypothetical protein